jgi:hypothetical protein
MADTLGTLKTAYGLAKDLVDLHDATARQGKVAELQKQILDAQESALAANQERSELVESIRELKEKMVTLEAWHIEKQRYELKELEPGAFAYVIKESVRGSEPVHWLCTTCYERGKKRILQAHRGDASYIYHKCHECGGEIRTGKPPSPLRSAAPAGRYNPFRR